ncbi:MAG: DUF456 domain-containing protein [Chitinophagaceae bacterium]|nr:MAG: DUF456 domain-containing protein [Chitinophagaceae bacterium]
MILNHYADCQNVKKCQPPAHVLPRRGIPIPQENCRISTADKSFFVYIQQMEWLWITLGILCAIGGLAGSILPLIPGPPFAYLGLLLQQLRDPDPFSARFLWIWAGVVLLSLILDYLIPVWGTRVFGGTKYGAWGTTIGFLLAFWMGPIGVIAGPFLGAFVGEMIGGQGSGRSMRSAWGSFLGFLLGSLLKIILCVMIGYYIIRSV